MNHLPGQEEQDRDPSEVMDLRRGEEGSPRQPGLAQDVWAILGALFSFFILGGAGAAIMKTILLSGETFLMAETIPLLAWLLCAVLILGRIPGDLLCGFLLGAFLRRVSPWAVLGMICLYTLIILTLVFAISGPDSKPHFDAIGNLGIAVQSVLKLTAIIVAIALGISIGKWWRMRHEQEKERNRKDNR